ncbi:MAG: tRNA (adenosine(37)-N6)-threonylcarbamoyltransferase complex dimerization subunit type 1 TsaB [Phycisphaerae bacterium]|nr:tRNA (adenosine(37)-N6)-threonylcarbamoyltransferase complex dimerization subunit type 1 TsaB [Phycisphaerae bacterium]
MSNSEQTYRLAIETSGRVGSVALGMGNTILSESSFSGFMRHNAELFDVMDGLLSKVNIRPGQIDRLYITSGPGSFTGIRIAVTLSIMMAYAVNTQIVAVDTLDALAQNAVAYCTQTGSWLTRAACILDAKQGRFFAALYERSGDRWEKLLSSTLLYPEELMARINEDNIPVGLLGEGLTYYADRFSGPLTRPLDEAFWSVTASGVYTVGQKMAEQGHFADPYTLVPAYIRKPDAVEKREKDRANT